MNENNKETKREYAKVYRFGDRVAIYIRSEDATGQGMQAGTVYISEWMAQALAETLARFAEDIRTTSASHSTLCGHSLSNAFAKGERN